MGLNGYTCTYCSLSAVYYITTTEEMVCEEHCPTSHYVDLEDASLCWKDPNFSASL